MNFTASGTYTCKLIVTSSNCASINKAYAGAGTNSIKICTSGDCSAFSTDTPFPSSSPGNTTCDNIINDFSFCATI